MFRIAATAIVTAILISAFWIFAYNIAVVPGSSEGKVTASGEKIVVDPQAQPPVTIAEGVTVGPAGLALPVAGVKPHQLSDTYTQARAGGARLHDAIDIMAPEGTPVVASAEGAVEKLFFSQGGGGISVYVRSPDRRLGSRGCSADAASPSSVVHSEAVPSLPAGPPSASRSSACA